MDNQEKDEKTVQVASEVERRVRRQALGDALRKLKSADRFDLKWEWMAESVNGEFIKYSEIEKQLLTLLHDA